MKSYDSEEEYLRIQDVESKKMHMEKQYCIKRHSVKSARDKQSNNFHTPKIESVISISTKNSISGQKEKAKKKQELYQT